LILVFYSKIMFFHDHWNLLIADICICLTFCLLFNLSLTEDSVQVPVTNSSFDFLFQKNDSKMLLREKALFGSGFLGRGPFSHLKSVISKWTLNWKRNPWFFRHLYGKPNRNLGVNIKKHSTIVALIMLCSWTRYQTKQFSLSCQNCKLHK